VTEGESVKAGLRLTGESVRDSSMDELRSTDVISLGRLHIRLMVGSRRRSRCGTRITIYLSTRRVCMS
jgi:hypothetical protein